MPHQGEVRTKEEKVKKIGYIDGRRIKGGDFDLGLQVIYWDPTKGTLQALINSLTGTANLPYTIMVPPGRFSAAQLGVAAPLSVKPWVNLKGCGGKGRMTIFAGMAVTMLDASIPAGINRWRMEGIRLETSPLTLLCTAAGHTLVAVLDDCPCNAASPIITLGNTYGAAATMVNLEMHNMNIDCNAAPQLFRLSRVSFWSVTCLGLYFRDSDAYFFGCDISAGCNVVNDALSVGGWFEFNGCKIDVLVLGDPTSQSVLSTLCGSSNENVQVHGLIRGDQAPNLMTNPQCYQPGTLYYAHGTQQLFTKNTDIGVNGWLAQA
jgi:hypothetical protein